MQIRYNDIKFFSTRFLVFLFFVLVFGRGSSLVVNFDPRINPIGFLLYVICFIYLSGKPNFSRIKSSNSTTIICGTIFAVWLICHLLFLDAGIPIIPYTFFVLHIFTGILLIKKYNKDIVVYFEKAMVFLSVISIIGWGIESVGMSSLLLKSPILLENSAGSSEYSLILYTINGGPSVSQELYGSLFRNSGCAWEPGLFSVMLCIAILFNIFQNKKIIFSKRLTVLTIALITTFSTTGYVMGIIIFAGYYLFYKKISFVKRLIYIVIISIGSYYIYTLPFMSGKIEEDTNTESFSIEDGGVEAYEKEGIAFTVGRFEGIMLDYMNIKDKPINVKAGGTEFVPIAVFNIENTIVNLKKGVIETKINGKSENAAIVINN